MDAPLTTDVRHPTALVWLARTGWLLLLALVVVMLATNAPANVVYARLDYQVQEALPAIMSFTSVQRFAEGLVAARWLAVAVYFAVALLIAWRTWDDVFTLSVSATLLALAWGFVMRGDSTTWRYPPPLLEMVPSLPFILAPLPVLGLILFFFLFPDGRFAFRWHKWVALAASLATLLFYYVDWNRALWFAYRPVVERWAWPLWGAILFGSLLVAMAGQIYRYYRRATPAQRQQMKWVLFGLAGILSVPLSAPLMEAGGAWGALAAIGLGLVAFTFLPITVGFSVLRYRLWDVDLLINRTLVFGGLTLLVAAGYILVVGLLGALFQTGNNLFLSILATGLVAILFHPLRQRLQQAVNRLMYGERDNPVTVLSRLGERLEDTAVPEATLPGLVETIAQALKLPYVALVLDREVETEKKEELVAAQGQLAGRAESFALIYRGQHLGRLLVTPRAPGESFTVAELRLLENIARQAGAAVYAYRLTRQLQRSRERLVNTREEERRRLRRDLHDGLGPRLATLTLKVDAARNYLRQEPQAADALLVELQGEIQEALQDVRRMAYDLRPPALDQLGLAPALIEFAAQHRDHGLQINVETLQKLPPLSAAVEVAVYRIAVEAMTNVVRHAQARHCTVRLAVNDVLCLEVADDGVGLPYDAADGVGLTSMRERAAELGGTFELESTPEGGTRVIARLPVGRTEP